MKAIVCVLPRPKGMLAFLRLMFSPPLTCQKANIGTEPLCIYSLNPFWKCRFPKFLSSIGKEHSQLLFDEGMKAYPTLYEEPSPKDLFFENFGEILSCHCGGRFIKPAVIVAQKDERILAVLEALSHHAKAVTLCTLDVLWFEEVSLDAMQRFGLSVNRREASFKNHSDLTVILCPTETTFSRETPVISMTKEPFSAKNMLTDFSSQNVGEFFRKFPQLRLKHCYLVPENDPIQKLIWKIPKKS